MALEFSSAGVQVRYCVEATSGSRPTEGYTVIPSIKSSPDFNAEPSLLDVTDFSDTVWKRAISGLRDVGGALAFTANMTNSFKTAWASLVSAYSTAKASNKSVWFEVAIPNFESFYFAGQPIELGLKGMDVDSVVEADGYVVPNQIVGWSASSTSVITG